MDKQILEQLRQLTDEEKEILSGLDIDRSRYGHGQNFVIDSDLLLKKGRLIEIRPHTRFVHFPKHSHNYVEMVYMVSGKTHHILNEKDELTLNQGELLFLNQNATQEILPAGENDIAVNFILLPEFFDEALHMIPEGDLLRDFLISTLSPESSFLTYLHFPAADILPVQNLMENMIYTLLYQESETVINTINRTTMGLLLQTLSVYAGLVNQGTPSQYEQNLLLTVLKYIDSHYKHGSLEAISEQTKQPAYYISRLLKKHTGKNFKEQLLARRLQQAAYLLSHTTLTIEDIYTYIGYDNSSYFYRKFKELYGMSPRDYRIGQPH
ncbi:AraC family transcriptional regulator [Butyrivibrio sp. AE3004]|uniref:AraC family transcriptional regulator n=1 Tax=Butyrivibrio sp. AE3004 TaxID=1506994 RepID=UPI0004944CD4|nr:AraC family transcriptional regulator [Butyrivibrio sp. AE3004]